MRLVRLVLDNVCQHTHLDWHFKPGIIGIYGPNGSGKTNALMAAYAALTGDFSRHAQNQSGMVRQGTPDDEPSRIQLWVEHGGDMLQITVDLARELSTGKKRGSKTTLKVNNEKPITKATEVREKLDKILGAHRRLIDQFVFVGADSLLGILSQDSEQRAKSLAHLAGTYVAEQAYNLLFEQIKADEPLATAVEDNSDEIRQRIGEAETRREELKAAILAARRKLVDKDTRQMYRRQLAIREALPSLRKTLATGKAAIAAAKQAYSKASKARKQAAEEVDALEMQHDRLKDKAIEWRAQLKTINDIKKRIRERDKAQSQLEAAQHALASLGEPPEPPGEDHELRDLEKAIGELKRTIAQDEQFTMVLGGKPKCPTCGTPAEQLADKIEETSRKLPELRDTLSTLQRQHAELEQRFQQYRRRLSQYEQKRRGAENDQTVAERLLASLRDVPSVAPSAGKLQEQISSYEAVEDELKTARYTLRTKEQAEATARGKYQEAIREAKKTLAEIKSHKAELDSALSVKAMKAALREHVLAAKAIAGHKARREELANTIEREREAMARLQERLKRVEAARRCVETMRFVREQLLHRDQLPRDVHLKVIEQLVPGINRRISEFALGYRVEAHEDLSFTAFFMDGRVVPAQVLSKGEKVGLALNFRMEINTLFARQLGMLLVLDEPTDGFDEANRQVTSRLLGELGEQLAGRGQQLIVVTHDPDLQGCFQQLIRLGAAA